MPGNVAQLEFFLYEAENIVSIVREVKERAKDNKRIKLVVRIDDADYAITAKVQEAEMRREQFDQYLLYEFRVCKEAGLWRRWSMARRRRRLGRGRDDAQKRLLELALSELKRAVRAKRSVALEPFPGAPFRLARDDEMHELLESARRAKSLWVFVFKPNELTADTNTLVVQTM
jgi:hypothetical protein